MNDLPVTQSASQSSTQAPQSSANQTAVQPGTTTSLLNASSGGIELTSPSVSTVAFPATASIATAKPEVSSHGGGSNVALSSLSVLLFVIAAVLFYVTTRPVKTTTE